MSPTGGVISALTPYLKRTYSDNFVETLAWKRGPLAAMIPKSKADGQPTWAMRVGNSPARSATYSVAATQSEAFYTRAVQPTISQLQSDYGRATIAGNVLAITGNKIGAFYGKFVGQIDGIMDAVTQSFSTKIYRRGFGCAGRIAAAGAQSLVTPRQCDVTTTVLVLRQREDIVNFEVNQLLNFSLTENANTLRNTGVATDLGVLSLNTNSGFLTMKAVINTVTGTVGGDYIFIKGDRQDSATPSRICVAGMDDWLSIVAPTPGESYFGIDRSTDGRLQPTIVDCSATGNYSGADEEQALIIGAAEVRRFGGLIDKVFLNDTRYQNLLMKAMGRYRPAVAKGPAEISFKGIELNIGSGGSVEVYPDPFCPMNRIYGLTMDTLEVVVGKDGRIPGFLDWDGNTMLRQSADDGIECRVGYYAEVRCNAPIYNFVATYGDAFGV
jgi:hypothetical protein